MDEVQGAFRKTPLEARGRGQITGGAESRKELWTRLGQSSRVTHRRDASGSRKCGVRGAEGCAALITHQLVPQRSRWLLPPGALVHSQGLGYSVAEPHCPASASEGHGGPFSCLLSPAPGRGPDAQLWWVRQVPGPQGGRLCSQGGGRAGTRGPHGKHGGPRRLEHAGLGVPVLLNMGAHQIPGRQAGHCASRLVLPLQNHKCWHSEGKGLPAHSGLQTFLLNTDPTHTRRSWERCPHVPHIPGQAGKSCLHVQGGVASGHPRPPEMVALSLPSGRPGPAPTIQSTDAIPLPPTEPGTSLRPFCRVPQHSSRQPNMSCVLVEPPKAAEASGGGAGRTSRLPPRSSLPGTSQSLSRLPRCIWPPLNTWCPWRSPSQSQRFLPKSLLPQRESSSSC